MTDPEVQDMLNEHVYGAQPKPTLAEKIAEIEAFERTPGGGALVKYRSAITVAVMSDETNCDGKRARCWAAVREAESALIAEIKRLQAST